MIRFKQHNKKEMIKINKRRKIAISEILILVIAIIAFAYFVGEEFEVVSAPTPGGSPDDTSLNADNNIPSAALGPVPESVTVPNDDYRTINEIETNNARTGGTPVENAEQPKGGLLGNNLGVSGIMQDVAWAGAILTLGQAINAMGIGDKTTVNAISIAASAGLLSGRLSFRLLKTMDVKNAVGWGAGIGIGVAIIVFLMLYKKTDKEIVTFECNSWQPATGGSKCEECNKQSILPCSEYQCKSLGQACELLNKGTSEERCTWVNRKDVDRPIIKPWSEVLSEGYKYVEDKAISPPDRGVKIVNTKTKDGCVKAFTPLSFGITVNEPSMCKLDYLPTKKIDDMRFNFGGSNLFRYNHTQILSLPGPTAEENGSVVIQNDGNYNLFVKCKDANGNENLENFVFKFCVEKGPDTTAPLIITTNLLNGMPIGFNQSSVDVELYVNEPASCKWSHKDQAYDKMEENFNCAGNAVEMNAQMLYTCKTTLTGLKNAEANDFYFRCKDQPSMPENDRNVNQQSTKFTLMGTRPLIIDWVKPNGTIKDATNSIKVTLEAQTSQGYKSGEATCYYSESEEDDSYIMFFNTNVAGTNKHSQELYLGAGSYKYYIKCLDLGGNADIKTVEFKVESDTQAPSVVRIYKEENYLKIITNEEAECVYSKNSCSYTYEDGIKMTTVDKTKQFAEWNTNFNYYIKCKDKYGNQPMPSVCNIVARPTQVFEEV